MATRSAAPALDLDSVVVRFGGVTALDGVDLTVEASELCGLIGPNGAGKTTLFDVVSGITGPDAGRVHLSGRDVTGWSPTRRARAGLRRTFQRVQTYGWLSVEDNVVAALDWRGGGSGLLGDLVGAPGRRRRESERRTRAREVLEQCGLSALRDAPAGSLPIGVSRLVELARAIADPPRVLMLDEPTSGLDEAEADRLGELIDTVRRAEGCAVLLVEHDVGFVLGRCDRVVVLDLGSVLTSGSPAEVRDDPSVRTAYLGSTA
ncbi:MAG: ABC transporter ATP-binding protein [Acidimicrobiia bacterium]|nr:ABC transporter ATP-binding protein [Acidimicrobiia bacterium]